MAHATPPATSDGPAAPDPQRRACLRRLATLSAWTALAGCGGGGSSDAPAPAAPPPPASPPPASPPTAPSPPLQVTTVAQGLDSPWGLAFLPDGRMLVTEKPGALRLVTPQGQLSTPLAGTPAVAYEEQGGLLDVLLDADFARNGRIYLSYAEPGSGGTKGTAVARGVLDLARLRVADLQVIFRMQPKLEGARHYGGRLAQAGDGALFVTLGDRQLAGDGPQRLDTHLGKVVRIRPDGSVPHDNPFVGRPGALPEIWSVGHRNVQGAAIHPGTGELWTCEHGPQGGDEVNITRAGRDHGWPQRSYGCDYGQPVGTGCAIGGGTHAPRFEEPRTYWVPTSIAPSGLAFYAHDRIPEWRGNLFTGALAGRALWRLVLDGAEVVFRERLLAHLNQRIRDVRTGPDGLLYLLTDGTSGRLLRIQA